MAGGERAESRGTGHPTAPAVQNACVRAPGALLRAAGRSRTGPASSADGARRGRDGEDGRSRPQRGPAGRRHPLPGDEFREGSGSAGVGRGAATRRDPAPGVDSAHR